MRTLLIRGGDTPIPDPVREVIVRGSTSLEERTVSDFEASPEMSGADRIVFWSEGDDATRALAARCSSGGKPEAKEAVVFVTPDGAGQPGGLGREQVFEWPRDEDRLVMAFMTGA